MVSGLPGTKTKHEDAEGLTGREIGPASSRGSEKKGNNGGVSGGVRNEQRKGKGTQGGGSL